MKNVKVALVQERKLADMEIDVSYTHDVLFNNIMCSVELVFCDDMLKGIIYNDNNKDIVVPVVLNPDAYSVPRTIQEYYKSKPFVKDAVVTWNLAGGNASQNAVSNKVSIPKRWLDIMNITEDNRSIRMVFDGQKITIEKK